MTAINLSVKQSVAVQQCFHFICNNKNTPNFFKLGGYAGVGKTFLCKKLVEQLESEKNLTAAVCAFTGKAANRLSEKGLPDASTIHSLIYEYDKERKKFFLKKSLPGIDYFLIDEASMISEQLWNDLQTFNKPFILVGDPAQLEPVGKDVFLMNKPDFLLTEIFRQAEGSGIIDFATDIRNGILNFNKKYDDVCIISKQIPDSTLLKADIILVLSNKLRITLNKHIRKLKGFNPDKPVAGDQIIILQNSKQFFVNNGEIFTIDKIISENDYYYNVKVTERSETFPLLKNQFNNPKKIEGDFFEDVWADYAYAITCHKSQGSEWDNVIVYDCGRTSFIDTKRWRYTAITRAKKNLIYVY